MLALEEIYDLKQKIGFNLKKCERIELFHFNILKYFSLEIDVFEGHIDSTD